MDVRLEWLEIRKFRNVKPRRLAFNGGHNVLLGLNATGKTTLLNLVAMVINGSFEDIRDEEFEFSFAASYAGTRVEGEVRNKRTKGSGLKFWDSRNQMGAHRLGVEWSMDIQLPSPTPRYSAQWPEPKEKSAIHLPSPGAEVPFSYPSWLATGLLSSRVAAGLVKEQDAAPSDLVALVFSPCFRLDESLGYFQRLSFRPPLDTWPDKKKRTPVELATWPSVIMSGSDSSFRGVPEELRNTLAARPQVEDDLILDDGNQSQLTRTAALLLGVDQVAVRLHWLSADDGKPLYGGIKFLCRTGSTSFSEDRLSYGQKRLLGFLYYAACANVIVADELVNGLHHSWIGACVKETGDRQSFLTSQNALLLDHLELKSAEEAEKMFIVCNNENGQLSWENITMEQAKDIFAAREVGIQQLSEILLARKLW
jgi:hypothetical protein